MTAVTIASRVAAMEWKKFEVYQFWQTDKQVSERSGLYEGASVTCSAQNSSIKFELFMMTLCLQVVFLAWLSTVCYAGFKKPVFFKKAQPSGFFGF